MDYKEMNDVERDKLKAETKKEIKNLFNWFKKSTYLESAGLANKKIKNQLKEIDVANIVSYILNANSEFIKVSCDFNNEFFEGDNRSGKFFIWGEARIYQNLENIISMEPSSNFICENEFDDSECPEDYSRDLIKHLNINDINMYRGTFHYTGIVSEESSDMSILLENMKLFNEVQVRYIEDNEPAWKKHISASYRLYNGESYQLAFLMAFIGFDSLIELMNETLKDVYLLHENEMIDFQLKNYNPAFWTAIKIMREQVLVAESYKRLERLENPNRKLVEEKLATILQFTNSWENSKCKKYIGKFLFFEVIRNSLAHGNDCDKSYIQRQTYFGIYKKGDKNDIDFDKLYVGLLLSICQLIEDLIK